MGNTLMLPRGLLKAPEDWAVVPSGLLVPAETAALYDRPVGIDLFAGAGGFSLGCEMAGIHMAAAVECWPEAALTYLVNLARPGVKIHFDTPEREAKFTRLLGRHLGVDAKGKRKVVAGGALAGDGWISHQPAHVRGCEHFFLADARNVTGQQILDALGMKRGEVTTVVGGPPCQGFSIAGKRDVMDPRNSLVFEFCRLVLEIWPKTFVMENVPNVVTMLTPEGVPVIDAMCRILADGGFSEYDALRKTVAAQAGTAMALRRDKAAPKRRRKSAAMEPEPEKPPALFDLAATS
jgi:DNA (cytosine-5)-methyltransferase 1